MSRIVEGTIVRNGNTEPEICKNDERRVSVKASPDFHITHFNCPPGAAYSTRGRVIGFLERLQMSMADRAMDSIPCEDLNRGTSGSTRLGSRTIVTSLVTHRAYVVSQLLFAEPPTDSIPTKECTQDWDMRRQLGIDCLSRGG